MGAAVAVPVFMGLLSMAFQDRQAGQQERRADKAREKSQKFYEQTSKPDPAAVEAQATQNRGEAGQRRLGSYQNLSKNLASRGFGSGSGLGYKGAADIESAYAKTSGESETELTKFANTRQFAPGQDAYGTSVPGGSEAMFGQGSNMLNSALGMYMANKMLNPGTPTAATPAMPSYNPYQTGTPNTMGIPSVDQWQYSGGR